MLIASRIQRPTAPIDLGTRIYFFKPRDPSDPKSEHVAEVTDHKHLQQLLAITECYYISEQQELPPAPAAPTALAARPIVPQAEPVLGAAELALVGAVDQVGALTEAVSAAAAPPAPIVEGSQAAAAGVAAIEPPSTIVDGQTANEPAGAVILQELDDETRAAGVRLNELSWQALRGQLEKGGIPREVLAEALRLEEAKPVDDQRATTIKLLKGKLG